MKKLLAVALLGILVGVGCTRQVIPEKVTAIELTGNYNTPDGMVVDKLEIIQYERIRQDLLIFSGKQPFQPLQIDFHLFSDGAGYPQQGIFFLGGLCFLSAREPHPKMV